MSRWPGAPSISIAVPVSAADAEESIEVDGVAFRSRRRTVRRVGNHVDERMLDRAKVALREAGAVVAARIVQRCENDVEAPKLLVVEIERSVEHDVHFDAVEDLDPAHTRPDAGDFRACVGMSAGRQSRAKTTRAPNDL